MQLSAVVPLWQDRPASENLAVAIAADELGFSELWLGEMASYDVFALATAIGLRTRQITLNLGPLAVSVRTPMTMAMGIASVAELTGRQVNLALGASSEVVVAQWHGRERERTARHMAETAQISRALLAGEKVNFGGELASCRGYRLRLDPVPGPLTIAAFSPAAVRAAGRHGDRMLLNMVSPASVRDLRQQLESAAASAGRARPQIAVWLCLALDPQRASLDQLLRAIVGYLAAPGYAEMISAAGFADLVEFARSRPHPKQLLAAIPDELVSAIGLVGSEAAILERLEQYREAGADEVCLVPSTAADPAGRHSLASIKSAWAREQG